MEYEKRLREIETKIDSLNHRLKQIGNKHKSKTEKMKTKRLIKRLKVERHLIHIAVCQLGYGIDNFSQSIVSVSKHKSRYLRDSKGYHNERNYLIAVDIKGNGYVMKTDNSQITHKAFERLRKYILSIYGSIPIYTDNRHRFGICLSKSYTQHTERKISQIKKPIYRKLRDMRHLSIEELDNIYLNRFMELGLKLID